MKNNRKIFASLLILACLIVLPVIGSVNAHSGNSLAPASFWISEGNPMPNPLPPAVEGVTLLAEGNPMPNPLPPSGPHFADTTAVA